MIRVYVREDFPRMDLAVWVVATGETFEDGGTRVFQIDGEVGAGWVSGADGQEVKPTFRIPAQFGQQIFTALAEHFGTPTDIRSLRKDYDAERVRVDRLIGAFIGVTP